MYKCRACVGNAHKGGLSAIDTPSSGTVSYNTSLIRKVAVEKVKSKKKQKSVGASYRTDNFAHNDLIALARNRNNFHTELRRLPKVEGIIRIQIQER